MPRITGKRGGARPPYGPAGGSGGSWTPGGRYSYAEAQELTRPVAERYGSSFGLMAGADMLYPGADRVMSAVNAPPISAAGRGEVLTLRPGETATGYSPLLEGPHLPSGRMATYTGRTGVTHPTIEQYERLPGGVKELYDQPPVMAGRATRAAGYTTLLGKLAGAASDVLTQVSVPARVIGEKVASRYPQATMGTRPPVVDPRFAGAMAGRTDDVATAMQMYGMTADAGLRSRRRVRR